MNNVISFMEYKEKYNKNNELIPMEEWDGEDWKTMFNALAEMLPDNNPWDTFAMFIKETLM